MPNFLVLSNDYTKTDIALYDDATQISKMSDDAKHSSKYLIPLIKKLLEKNNIPLKELDFIAVNQGPGKFTSLRVLLATANGLSFATHVPLVGIDGITTLLDEYHQKDVTVALLNAFNNDAFYGVAQANAEYETGYKNIEVLLSELKAKFPENIIFIGSGIPLFENQIKNILESQAIISSDYPHSA